MARNFKFKRNLAGGNFPPVIMELPVAATQTLVVGDAVVMSSSQIAKAGAASGVVVGVMAEDSTTQAAGTMVEVEIAMPWQVWEAVATADATNYVLDGTHTYDLTSAQLVDVADTTGGSLAIIGIDADDNTLIEIQFTDCFFNN